MNNVLTDRDIEILSCQAPGTLAIWWRQLNSWKWPDEFPNPEDPDIGLRVDLSNIGQTRRSQAMNWIMKRIGLKACLREWNREQMDDQKFESWWLRQGLRIRTSPN
jgi:hypothetical protein